MLCVLFMDYPCMGKLCESKWNQQGSYGGVFMQHERGTTNCTANIVWAPMPQQTALQYTRRGSFDSQDKSIRLDTAHSSKRCHQNYVELTVSGTSDFFYMYTSTRPFIYRSLLVPGDHVRNFLFLGKLGAISHRTDIETGSSLH